LPNLTIRFINEADLVSKLIAWQTDSLWIHTEALSRDGKHWIGAHAGTGVQARPLNWCKPTREAVYAVPVTDVQYEAAMAWLEDKLGEPYNYKSIVGIALHVRLTADGTTDCSALMLAYLMQGGHFPLNCLEGFEYLITPETLHLSPTFIGRKIDPITS
jgi:uncharacterized protein YycO